MVGMERKAIRFRQVAIGDALIAIAWLAWGLAGVAALPRELGLDETWWLFPILLGPSTIAAAYSLFGFHKHAGISFVMTSIVAGTPLWLFVAAPLWLLVQSVFFP